MTDDTRQPHSDADLIDELTEDSTPAHSGTSGGSIQREVGRRDELHNLTGEDPLPTSVHKSDKPDGGDEPNLPNRDGGGGPQGSASAEGGSGMSAGGGGEGSSRSGPPPRRTS